jgi:hypothetical protein
MYSYCITPMTARFQLPTASTLLSSKVPGLFPVWTVSAPVKRQEGCRGTSGIKATSLHPARVKPEPWAAASPRSVSGTALPAPLNPDAGNAFLAPPLCRLEATGWQTLLQVPKSLCFKGSDMFTDNARASFRQVRSVSWSLPRALVLILLHCLPRSTTPYSAWPQ